MFSTKCIRVVSCVLAVAFIAVCFIVTAKVGRRMPYSHDDMMNLYFAWVKSPWELLIANLTFAPGIRPMGGAFYRAQFALWGYRSQPLHGAVWSMLALNLWLAWRLFRRLGANAEASLIGVLILAMHGTLLDLSFNAGTLYDTLCFTFYVLAMTVYLRARSLGVPGWRSLLLFGLPFACALNAKEMAASLPLILLIWELSHDPPPSFHPRALVKRVTAERHRAGAGVGESGNPSNLSAPGSVVPRVCGERHRAGAGVGESGNPSNLSAPGSVVPRVCGERHRAGAGVGESGNPSNLSAPGSVVPRICADWRGVVLSAILTAIFAIRSLSPASNVHGLAAYTPACTWSRWLETTAEYLALTFYQIPPAPKREIAVYLAVIAAAILATVFSIAGRRKSFAAFAILWFPIALLPISFVTPRVTGYVLYIPMLGWALGAGMLLAAARERIARFTASTQAVAGSRVLLLLAVAAAFYALNRWYALNPSQPHDPERIEDSPVETTARQFRKLYPGLHSPTRLLFVRDAFARDTWAPLMTLRLMYHDPRIDVDRLTGTADQHPPLDKLPHYDHIFTFSGGKYVEIDNTDTYESIAVLLPPGRTLGEYMDVHDDYMGAYVVSDVQDGHGDGRWTGAEPAFRFKLRGTQGRRLAARFVVVGETLRQNGPKELRWYVNHRELAHSRYEREGQQTIDLPVPPDWLSTSGFTTVDLRVENPYIAASDQAKLGVFLKEIGFR